MTLSFTFGHLHHSKEAIKLPVDVATETTAFIGRRGSGKSHGARVVVEGVLDADQQVVVFDPLNIWWGLRLKKDGKTAAYNVYIFGGDHADQPLVEQSGALVADFVIDTGSSVVLSMRHLSKTAMRRFVADFNERLMERKQVSEHRGVLLVVLDEADLMVPQRLQPEMTRCFGVVDDLVRRGRASGIGTLMLSQRPAVINKDVLAMTEIMVCLQVTSPQDRKALLAWVEANADSDKADTFTGTLPTLKRGEAIIWSPSLLNIFERILIKDTSTYDSSYTPKVGEKSRGTVKLRPVDLAKLTEQLQAVAKEAEENKPGKLKARIKELEKALQGKGNDRSGGVIAATELATKMVKATVAIELAKARKEWGRVLNILGKQISTTLGEVNALGEIVQNSMKDEMNRDQVAKMHAEMHASMPAVEAHPAGWTPKLVGQKHPDLGRRPHGVPAVPRADTSGWKEKSDYAAAPLSRYSLQKEASDGKLGKAERKVLTVLAHYGSRSKAFVAAHAGYSVNTGHFSNCLGALRSRGYLGSNVEGGLVLLAEGREALGEVEALPSGDQLWDQWMSKLGKGEKAILEALRKWGELDKSALGEETRYSANTGHFNNCLGRLRGLNLITGSNPIQLTEEFKEAIS